MRSEVKYPRWVNEILKKINVTIYRGRKGRVLKENVPILSLPSRLLSHGGSTIKQRAFIIGFEDEEEIWNQPPDCGDIVVKIYDLKEPGKYRVEIFCSGVNKKVIKFDNKEVLNYQGYEEEDIRNRRQIVGTVIFDVQIREYNL
ncbi:MAG: hypothetical protein DRN15_07220 [Thermoprotei archaeon]|nr:MAG: hypothetical protein DRN15_07220 [Thermoprotei archaeon]